MGHDSPSPFMGYPDMGAGKYSRMLTYKNWFEFNCAQRVHANNIEHLSWTMPVFLINGLFFPRITAGLGLVVLGGRELYRMGYMSPQGPTSEIREYGAYPLNISELLAGLSVAFIFIRYQFGGFVSRRKVVQYFTKSKYNKELEEMQKNVMLGKDKPTILVHTPGELSETAKKRDNRLKEVMQKSRFDK